MSTRPQRKVKDPTIVAPPEASKPKTKRTPKTLSAEKQKPKTKAKIQPVLTPETIAIQNAEVTFLENLSMQIAEGVQSLLQEPQKHIANIDLKYIQNIWQIYPRGSSYYINYYMYNNRIEDHFKNLLESDFKSFIEYIVEYQFDFVGKKTIDDFNTSVEKNIDEFYQGFTTTFLDLKMKNGQNVIDYLCESIFTTPKERLDVLIKFFIETFRDNRVAKSSNSEIIVYRGIVGPLVEDKAALFKPTKAFTSTSTQKTVAIRHTEPISSRIGQLKDTRKVILEMHLKPGIKYIDYNSLRTGDNTDAWQKEFILPPGLNFKEKESRVENGINFIVVEVSAQSFTGGGKRHKKITSSKK
jgi:hypothetical protein